MTHQAPAVSSTSSWSMRSDIVSRGACMGTGELTLSRTWIKLDEVAKNRKLNELLDTLEFNQVCGEITYIYAPVFHRCCIGRHLREIGCARY